MDNFYSLEINAQDHQQTMLKEGEQSRLASTAASGNRPTRGLNLKHLRQIFRPSPVSDEPRVVRGESLRVSQG